MFNRKHFWHICVLKTFISSVHNLSNGDFCVFTQWSKGFFSDTGDKRTSAIYMVPESGPRGSSHKQHIHDHMNNSLCET